MARSPGSLHRRLYMQPEVWSVQIAGHPRPSGDLYESRAAAQCHADWVNRQEGRAVARPVSLGHVHSLELARERWS